MLFLPESWDVVLNLVDVVLSDALTLGLALLERHVATNQVSHHRLQKESKHLTLMPQKESKPFNSYTCKQN